jgi:hypothetical protein
VEASVQVPRFDATRFISKLRSKCTTLDGNNVFFDWKMLGAETGICFNSVPTNVCFMLGPLENGRVPEKKVRTVRHRRAVEEEGEEEKPEETVKHQKKDADKLSQAEKNLKVMQNICRKKCTENYAKKKAEYDGLDDNDPGKKEKRRELKEHGEEIDGLRLLLNPKSFTQTTENLFGLSFMVKSGVAKVGVRTPLEEHASDDSTNNRQPLLTIGPGDENYENETTRQCVISFTMDDYRELCEYMEHNNDCGEDEELFYLPHRKTKQKRHSNSQSMSQLSHEEEA